MMRLLLAAVLFTASCGDDDVDQAPSKDSKLTGTDAGMDTIGPSAVFGPRTGPEPVQSPPR